VVGTRTLPPSSATKPPWSRWSHSASGNTGEEATPNNCYEVLGLDSSASSQVSHTFMHRESSNVTLVPQEIKRAFYDISKKYHPDLNPGNPEALKKFLDLSEAYEILSNPRLRRSYDRGTMRRATSVADKEATSHRVGPPRRRRP
jgi:hypothetical protein